jgi:hypothetical protein
MGAPSRSSECEFARVSPSHSVHIEDATRRALHCHRFSAAACRQHSEYSEYPIPLYVLNSTSVYSCGCWEYLAGTQSALYAHLRAEALRTLHGLSAVRLFSVHSSKHTAPTVHPWMGCSSSRRRGRGARPIAFAATAKCVARDRQCKHRCACRGVHRLPNGMCCATRLHSDGGGS